MTSNLQEQLAQDRRPDQETWGSVFEITNGPRPRVSIDAGYMAKYNQEDSTYTLLLPSDDRLGGIVTAYLFDEAGDSSAVLVANEIIYYELERRYEARGEVLVTTQDEKILETEYLTWEESERKIRTIGYVRITTPSEQIQGYDLTAEEDLSMYTLQQVTGRIQVQDNQEEERNEISVK